MRLLLLVLVFVCLCVCFFSACLLSDAPGGSKAGLPRLRPWIVVCFVFTGVAAGCLVFLSIFVLFLPLSLSPGPVQHYYMLNIATKINK